MRSMQRGKQVVEALQSDAHAHVRFFEGSWEHAVADRKLGSSTLEGGVGVEEVCRAALFSS